MEIKWSVHGRTTGFRSFPGLSPLSPAYIAAVMPHLTSNIN